MHDQGLETDDDVLVARVASHDHDALAVLYRRHRNAVVGLARRVLRDDDLAEDVAQTVFVGLWREPDRFDATRGTVRTWLLTQAHRRSVDLVRSEERRRRREDRHEVGAPRASVGDEAWDHLQRGAVRDAVRGLPADERDAVALAYLGGHTYREVAEMLGTPEGTVKSRIRTGLGRLHDRLVEDGGS